jgi:hypothetical protein
MRRSIVLIGVALWNSADATMLDASGRWEGAAAIPGRPLTMVVDLARDASGHWTGSIIVPELGVKGLPLAHLAEAGEGITFDLGDALGAPSFGMTAFALRFDGHGAATGEFKEGGHVARLSLRRTGAAQVDARPRSTPLAPALAAKWVGAFDLGGYPRNVTITLARGGDGVGTATFTVVGKKTTDIPVDLVTQAGDFLRLESAATQVSFEGHVTADSREIRGTIAMGSIELPLVLTRAGGST